MIKKLFPLTIVLCLFCGFLGSQAMAQEISIRDFKNANFDYGYEGWADLASVCTKTENGIHLSGPAAGGAGGVCQITLDLSESKQLVLKLKSGDNNTAREILLKLMNADQSEAFAKTVDISEVSSEEFTAISIDLPAKDAPEREKLSAIKQFQIQGTFAPNTKVDLIFQSLDATGTILEAPVKK